MSDAKYKLFDELYSDLREEETFSNVKPLLAHYTSIESLKNIMTSNEIWFSNPLFMNDLEELRYGLFEGRRLFWDNDDIRKACSSDERVRLLEHSFDNYFSNFEDEVAFDVYVFCLSEHDASDDDGLLSMWRGYGAQGNGVAIVLDFSKLDALEGSPLIISKVEYLSGKDRENWIKDKLSEFAVILKKAELTNDQLHLAAHALFERLKLFALFTKHRGFSEEREWRVVYLPDRDPNKALKPMFDYSLGKKGVEPRLKLKLEPIDGIMPNSVKLECLLSKIILGPAISSVLAQKSVCRMLEKIKKGDMVDRVMPSTISLRPT